MTELPDESEVPFPLRRSTPARMSASDFERFVAETFEQTRPFVDDLRVTLHETIKGVDGKYDFDATVRYRLGGMDMLVVVEAKRHKNPIKRDVVQTLHTKMTSVGAHKGVVIATAPFQRGALRYAETHGIALVVVTGETIKYEIRMMTAATMTDARQPAPPTGYCWSYTEGTTLQSTLVTHDPEHAHDLLLAHRPSAGRGTT